MPIMPSYHSHTINSLDNLLILSLFLTENSRSWADGPPKKMKSMMGRSAHPASAPRRGERRIVAQGVHKDRYMGRAAPAVAAD